MENCGRGVHRAPQPSASRLLRRGGAGGRSITLREADGPHGEGLREMIEESGKKPRLPHGRLSPPLREGEPLRDRGCSKMERSATPGLQLRFHSSGARCGQHPPCARRWARGPLWDIGIYCINAARYLFRDDPARCSPSRPEVKTNVSGKSTRCRARFSPFPEPGRPLSPASFRASPETPSHTGRLRRAKSTGFPYEYAEEIRLSVRSGERTEERVFGKRDPVCAGSSTSPTACSRKAPGTSGREGWRT